MKKQLIIKHLNNLCFKLEYERDLLLKKRENPEDNLYCRETDININYYDEEIKEIREIIYDLETNDI